MNIDKKEKKEKEIGIPFRIFQELCETKLQLELPIQTKQTHINTTSTIAYFGVNSEISVRRKKH